MNEANIIVSPLEPFAHIVKTYRPYDIISIVTITQMPQTPSYMQKENHLRLVFNDIKSPITGLKAASEEDIIALLHHGEKWQEQQREEREKSPLYIHCWMGISRSTAAALIIAVYLFPEKGIDFWVNMLREKSPSATPNPYMISLADHHLQLDGQLINAVKKIGRGRDAMLGNVFRL